MKATVAAMTHTDKEVYCDCASMPRSGRRCPRRTGDRDPCLNTTTGPLEARRCTAPAL
jgi:hypothetical protein